MIKKALFFILFCFIGYAYAQEEVPKIVLKIGKHQDFLRVVLISDSIDITHSINVTSLKDGSVKISFPREVTVEYEGKPINEEEKIKGVTIFKQNERSYIVKNLQAKQIKVARFDSPPRIAIDIYSEVMQEKPVYLATGSILIDPGHGGKDPGIELKDSSEKNLVLFIAKQIGQKLALKGLKVSLTRASDEDVSLKKRLSIENALKPSLFISLHLSSADYFTFYTSPFKKNLSSDNVSKTFSFEDKAVKNFTNKIKEKFTEPVYTEKIPLTLLRDSNSPALMIELPHRALLSDKTYLEKLVDVLSTAIYETITIKTKGKNE